MSTVEQAARLLPPPGWLRQQLCGEGGLGRMAEPGGGVGSTFGFVGANTPTPFLRFAPARPSPLGCWRSQPGGGKKVEP